MKIVRVKTNSLAEKIGLNLLSYFRKRYGCGVGFSDHSGRIFSGLAAATLGIDVLEVHVTFSKEMFGPDVSSSITIDELGQLVEGIQFIETTLENEVDRRLPVLEGVTKEDRADIVNNFLFDSN